MIINVNELDLIKGITRKEAKAVHKDLPEGGVWRTIKGHHVYIKDGKVLAGAIPGVTKAKKATKAHLKEHQAHIDKEAKKDTKKKAPASKTKKGAGKNDKSDTATTKGKKAQPDNGREPSGKPTGKGKQTDTKTKGAKPKAGASKTPSEDKELAKLASKTTDGMDMFMTAQEDPSTMQKLKDKLKTMEGSTKDKLDKLHKELGGGSGISEYAPTSTKKMDDFEPGKPSVMPSEVSINQRTDGRNALASAPSGASIAIHKDFMNHPENTQRYIIAHETGHILSNAYPGLASHILDNPEGALGQMNQKKMKFEGVAGTLSPEESWADAYSHYHTSPEWLKEKHPKAYDFVKTALSKIDGHQKYLDKAFEELDRMNGKSKDSEDGIEVYHGTGLSALSSILENGFKMNGTSDDFGHCAYFKSPAFDHLDHADHQAWINNRKAKNQPISMKAEVIPGYDTKEVVDYFSKGNTGGAVIKAKIDKSHVLDCTKGRPKDLDKMIQDFEKSGWDYVTVIKHMSQQLLKKTPSDEELESLELLPKIEKVWGRQIKTSHISPYEVYAKGNGIGVVVDKLNAFTEEGWQIGVYDPSIIKIADHGKQLLRNDDNSIKLMKALMKALQKQLPHCLLHHEFDEDGHLILHVGAIDDMKKSLYIDLQKAIPWREELHPRGKDGKFSSIRSGSKVVAKNGTKGKVTNVTGTHYHIEKEDGKTSKVLKDNVIHEKDHKELTKPKPKKKAPAKKKASEAKKPAPKKAPAKAKAEPKKPAPKASEAKKPAPKKPKKDIRSDAQKNRELAYDAGEKIGGARKDTWEQSFKDNPNQKTLADLEKDNPAVAEKLAVKKHILPAFDFETEHKNGVELPVAIMKKLIYDRIAPKPEGDTPEARKEYVNGINKAYRHFAGIKTLENMKNAVREFADLAHRGKRGREAEETMKKYKDGTSKYSYLNTELHERYIEEGKPAREFMDFSALGDKFEGFFTSYKSRESTMKTVIKNTKEGWDKYLNPETKAKNGGKPKDGNKKWERKAEAEHLRTGGKKISVSKPEELMKNFGVRGVEFGHWVNDASGKYHLQRSAEAFNDLSDVLGIEPKDISLNGRLAIAFGARGKGGALAHYEPDRKVINMTKHGGAGSLAHEWGHAMDNIMYQYSNGGQESLGLASEHAKRMGDHDPKLKAYYENLMDAIRKPAPGEKGGVKKIALDSEAKPLARYYPEMRRDAQTMTAEEIYSKWSDKINREHDGYIERTKNSTLRSPQDKEKQIKKYEQARKRELNSLPHYVAKEMKFKNGGYRGEPFKGEIEVSTGHSEYYTRMQEVDGNGKPYYAQGAEMFARVFESYVQHKLDKDKRYNNYLVHSTREKDVTNFEAPFPKGKERTHMFKAMENLLKHISKGKALKKALEMELLRNYEGTGETSFEEIQKSLGYTKRSAYNVPDASEVIYIPINRLKTPYQTELATNQDKVQENYQRMARGENLEPIVIGFDYDVHDGHHRVEASHIMDYTHVPCVVMNTHDEIGRQRAIEAYKEVWKSVEQIKSPMYGNHKKGEIDMQKSFFEENKHPRDKHGRFTFRGADMVDKVTVGHLMKDPEYDAKAKEVTWFGGDQHSQKQTLLAMMQHVGNAESGFDILVHHARQALHDDSEHRIADATRVRENFNHIYKRASKLAKDEAIHEDIRNYFEDMAGAIKTASALAKEDKKVFDAERAKDDHNYNVLEEHGMHDKSYFNNPFLTGFGIWNSNNSLDKWHVGTVNYAMKLSEGGKKGFTLNSSNVQLTFHPTKVEESKRDKSLPGKVQFKVDIKTAHTDIKGATLVFTRSENTKSRKGKRLPAHAQKDLNQYTMLFNFPKVKKKVTLLKTSTGEFEDAERWGYKHVDLSTEDNIRKTGDLILRMFKAHHEQKSKDK